MPKWWCINCQSEQQHEAIYCHSACGSNCNHRCERCKLETLANVSEPSLGDNRNNTVRQAVAQAQRQAIATRKTEGEIKIRMEGGNASSGEYQCQILIYDIKTKDYRVGYQPY